MRARHGLIKSVALFAFIQGQLKIDKQSRHDRDECIPRVFFSTYSRDKPIRQPIPSLCRSLVMWLEQVCWTMSFLSKLSCLHVVSTICMCQGKERVPWSTSLKLVNGHLFWSNRAYNRVHGMKPHKKAFQENRMQRTVSGIDWKITDKKYASLSHCIAAHCAVISPNGAYEKSKAARRLFTPSPKANV